MTDLRDFYAALAMHAMMKFAIDENLPREKIAEMAFKMADTMMKARDE
jgi:hypothetical protein